MILMTNKLFGTTGVRKIYGSEFDVEMAMNLGKALGSFLGNGHVLLARDARTTSEMMANAIAAGILSTGVSVTRAGIIPTPTLAFMTKSAEFDAGVMITASHNPPEYTGVKFWMADSMGFTTMEEQKLAALYEERNFKVADWDRLGKEVHIETAVNDHIEAILKRCDAELIHSKAFKVVVDPGNGVGALLSPFLLRKLGCRVVSINCQLDGHFPGRHSEPDEESLTDLVNLIRKSGADLGIAHDGDSDRVVFSTEDGEIIRGDRTIALLARSCFENSGNKSVVTTVDSSKVVDETVEMMGGRVIRTPVGDIHVALNIKESGSVFGGEACGVFIFPEFHLAPEPFLAIARVLEMMARKEQSFGSLISEIPKYPLKKTKIQCANEDKESVMAKLETTLPIRMSGVREVLTVDGLGISLEDGWVLVRPSGTEPVIRITLEASTEQRVTALLQEVSSLVRDEID